MSILADLHWEDLFNWIETLPQLERLPIDRSNPQRPSQQLRVWLHQLSPVPKAAKTGASTTAQAWIPPADCVDEKDLPAVGVAVKRQFRRLRAAEMSKLAEFQNPLLRPRPDPYFGKCFGSQTASEITGNLQQAIGYFTGSAPVSDEGLLKGDDIRETWFSLKVSVHVVLDSDYRGDAIIYGHDSPAENRRDTEED
ncbi:hypothetical protein PG994_004915 [Apiospora phragmitis]|uniref:Uncharacterized protein n=1 Tax=Apiospora phragmitis TaxID=2905665 RepID=A0ABR1VUM3_9PEZI